MSFVTPCLKSLGRVELLRRFSKRIQQGREVYISLRGKPLREVAGWLQGYERFWNEHLDQSRPNYNWDEAHPKK